MDEFIKGVFTAPLATIFIISGMLFLLIAVVGNISGKIEPGPKARIVSGILGVAFILGGLAMHVTQNVPSTPTLPAMSPTQTKSDQLVETPQMPPAATPMAKPNDKEVTTPAVETKYKGVVANVARFEKTGELVTLELIIRNTSEEGILVCSDASGAELIDELTGESWDAVHYGGSLGNCDWIQSFRSGRPG